MLHYAYQSERNPLVIDIHGNQTEARPDTYQRYLVNRFRQVQGFDGTPIRQVLRAGGNPYKGKRRTLTPR